MPAAFIAGANGITFVLRVHRSHKTPSHSSPVFCIPHALNHSSGSYIVEYLLSDKAPKHFDKVIATSRRAPNPEWVKHDLPAGVLGKKLIWIEADLYGESVEQLSKKFKEHGVEETTVLYWGAYAMGDGWGSASELELNEKMFSNCMEATLSVAKLDRCLLQLGAKWHVRTPMPVAPFRESDVPPNVPLAPFYNAQLEIAKKLSAKHGFSWTVTLPLAVFGATRQTAMTLATSLAVYILILKHLDLPMIFPGNAHLWSSVQDGTSADLLAELNVWASLQPQCANQILNAHNGDVHVWSTLWPRFLAYFGVPKEKILTGEEMEKHLGKEKGKMTVKTTEQITKEMAQEAWKKIREIDSSVEADGWKQGWESLWFLDSQWGFDINLVYSPTKLRSLGWTGYRDTEHSFYSIFDRLRKDGIVPNVGIPGGEAVKDVFPW